jgi:hypothetical protein
MGHGARSMHGLSQTGVRSSISSGVAPALLNGADGPARPPFCMSGDNYGAEGTKDERVISDPPGNEATQGYTNVIERRRPRLTVCDDAA